MKKDSILSQCKILEFKLHKKSQDFFTYKIVLTMIVSLLVYFPTKADILTSEQALQRFEGSTNTRSSLSNLKVTYTGKDNKGNVSLYIFTPENENGFYILSADDCAKPLLGYSDTNRFDVNNMPESLKYWLGEYSNQIEYMRENHYPAFVSTRSSNEMQAISPLVKTKWNQGVPYNDYCYTIAADGSETKSVTGCVATSMAQVMDYFQYPEIGTGEISYKHGDSGTYSMSFSEKPFQWNEMLDTYYPDEYNSQQADAVAYLMKACGYSVKMDYMKGESGASGTAIAGALVEYFKYDPGIIVQDRKFWTLDQWENMIYQNLSKVGPVVYNGSALDGGHSFVCDGFDGNGYFHINWGWGGMSDGYYLLDALNPDEYGIGGAAGGYNLGQQVILNISPKETNLFQHQTMLIGNATGTLKDNILTLSLEGDGASLQYFDTAPVEITFGVEIVSANNTDANPVYKMSEKSVEAMQNSTYHWDEVGTTINLDDLNLSAGVTYNIIIGASIKDGDSTYWEESKSYPGKYNYVSVEKTEYGYKLINHTPANLEVTDFNVLTSPIYQNSPIKFSATFMNNNSEALTRNYSAVILDSEGKEYFKTENYSINVAADTTIDNEWTSVVWYKENDTEDLTSEGEFTLKLYDNWEGQYVEGIEETITILPPHKDNKAEAYLSVEGAEKEGDVYVINGTEFVASITVKVTEGFFDSPINLGIEEPLSNGEYYTLMHKHFDAIPDLSAGQEQVFTMTMELPDADPSKIYHLQAWTQGYTFGDYISLRFNTEYTGINVADLQNPEILNVYSLSGVQLLKTADKTNLNNLPSGIYIVNGKKVKL